MTNFRLIRNGKLNNTKIKRSNSFFSRKSKNGSKKMAESMKPAGYEDQGYRDEN